MLSIIKAMDYLKTHSVEIGILGDGGSVTGLNGGSEDEITILEYGTYLEYGTSKMKPFGFFRQAIENNSDEIQEKIEEVTDEILKGNINGKQALQQVGEFLRGLIIEGIATAGSWARPLSPQYEKWKAKNYPNRIGQTLIKDGFLIKSIRYKIKRGTTIEYISDWRDING